MSAVFKENELEERLRKMRGYLAYRNGVKPFVIFKDSEIPLLLKAKPKKIEDLALVKGFPLEGSRVQKWGKEICSVFDVKFKIPELKAF